jgi:hypothetical protein
MPSRYSMSAEYMARYIGICLLHTSGYGGKLHTQSIYSLHRGTNVSCNVLITDRRPGRVCVIDDFEVSIFLTETTTRHSLLTKHKHFHDTTQTKLTSNSGRLIGATNEAPIDVDLEAAMAPITLRREESDDEDAAVMLAAIPAAAEGVEESAASRRPKRARANTTGTEQEAGRQEETEDSELEVISSDESDDEGGPRSGGSDTPGQPPHKRRKEVAAGDGDGDDKKKLAMDISYEGFSIYGRVLCLVVKRRDVPSAVGSSGRVASGAGGPSKTKQGGGPGGQTMMENFIISTQMPAGGDDTLDAP